MSEHITSWIKASRSGSNGGSCVEMRQNGTTVQVRDSKNPDGAILDYSPAEFATWLAGAKRGEFDALLD